jgi:hypothetical protein|tara:strand:+ start:519 stop:641 length:123 start_codon:yes stop_codon:yes gene_type:complete
MNEKELINYLSEKVEKDHLEIVDRTNLLGSDFVYLIVRLN